MAMTAKEHVAEIRRTKFSIGGEPNPLTEDLHHAVKNLSAELYAKDVHFLMELIQNAEDNEYPEGVDPSLEFVITSKDITNTGAPATLLVFNNEKGFSSKNIDSVCSVGRSTKKGLRKHGYIGEKGIGFKSVFLITSQPYIFSNGYQIKFNEKPCQHCNVGYIVPEWVEDDSILSSIQKEYGSSSALPNTILVLPLRGDKVQQVKTQLSSVHPEVLLFLSKIKRLSVRGGNENPSDTLSAVSISSEKNFVTSKSMNADSYLIYLKTGDNIANESGYHMWKQRFPVKQENKVDVRREVEEWVVTLAFPIEKRLQGSLRCPGIYAFLPTDTIFSWPHQGKISFGTTNGTRGFLTASLMPLNAFTTLVKSIVNAPVSSLPQMFRFLPIMNPSHPKLKHVQDSIKAKLMDENIVPCESFTGQRLFRKPREVYRDLLDPRWYVQCIAGSDIVMGVSEDVYLQLLEFISEYFSDNRDFKSIPLIKYTDLDGNVGLFKVNDVSVASSSRKLLSGRGDYVSWLTQWNAEFTSSVRQFFLSEVIQKECKKNNRLTKWLMDEVKVKFVTVYEYAAHLIPSINRDSKLAVTYAHFLWNSLKEKKLEEYIVRYLCSKMPIVDNYGLVTVTRTYEVISQKELIDFVQNSVKAYDIPYLSPPNAAVPTMSSPLTKANTFLLLNWLKYLRTTGTCLPELFLSSIKNGSWLKIYLNGCSGYKPPSESFVLESSLVSYLQSESVLVDIPLVDEKFYGEEIKNYKDELKTIGVRFEIKEACELTGKRLISLAASSEITKDSAIAILKFIKLAHFYMTRRNAEDNEYPEGVDPSLEFVITSKDITNTGAPAALLVFNNEKGFSSKNIDSVCSVGRSTKKGLRKHGYIGEKGIGFKSVFLITSQPYIFSNGYQIKFNEKPCQHCNVGYIVPEWVEDDSILSSIQKEYGSSSALPNTILVLPLRRDKVQQVKTQLSSIHPEVLLFLSKIKRIVVRSGNENPNLNKISAVSISSEKNFKTLQSINADYYLIHLKTGDDIANKSVYRMWKQRFPVKQENKVDVRREVEEWVVTLAFPIKKRLQGSSRCPGIYAFLPTDTVTNFPFIIQADFLLASSRENILWDNKWNQGILDCVPDAFLNAFTTFVKSLVNAPVSRLLQMFRFLPIMNPSHPKLQHIQNSIKAKLMNENIVPCESFTFQRLFRKPHEVYRLLPSFRSILNAAKSQHVSFRITLFSQGAFLLTAPLDGIEYHSIHMFFKIRDLDPRLYVQCIGGSDIVMGVSEDVYLQLLVFISHYFSNNTGFKSIPLIKYTGLDGNVELFKVNDVSVASSSRKLLSGTGDSISWLNQWNAEFSSSVCPFFLSQFIQMECKKYPRLKRWLMDEVKVKFVSVYEYANHLIPSLNSDSKLAVTYAHFLCNSLMKKHLSEINVRDLCSKMPIVDNYGLVTVRRTNEVLLVPANGSKWVELIGPNPWRQHSYVELTNDYTRSVSYFGKVTSHEELISFVQDYVKASDIPYLSPPNAAVPTMSFPLTKSSTFLLLNWLKNLRTTGTCLPELFLSSIKNGSWLKINLNGCSGYKPPSESFVLESSLVSYLQNESVLVDIPLVDEKFYGDEIKNYKDEFKTIGVRFEIKEACELTGKRLISLAASSEITKDSAIAILKFIKYLGENKISSEDFIRSIKGGKWVRTSRGYMTPSDSVLLTDEWNVAKQISDVPFIDHDYSGNEIYSFKKELELLGVVVNFDHNCYKIVSDNIKSSALLTCLSPEALLLILKCIQILESSDKLLQEVKNTKCLKTNLGYNCPSECFSWNPKSEWHCLLGVFGSFPVLDGKFYGNIIVSMPTELKKLGVMVEFEDTIREFIQTFKQQVSSYSISKQNVFSFLKCCRELNKMEVKFPSELKDCIREEKWLRTELGDYRSPNDCILFGEDWLPISSVSLLPFIDDSDTSYGSRIHEYRLELMELGVITDFKDGDKFIADGIFLPQDCSRVTTASVYSLVLDFVKIFKEKKVEIPAKFLDKLSEKKWLKTKCGYKSPDECLLFYSEWEPFLNRSDGPFIDEEYYGSSIGSYKEELNILGVITDIKNGCWLLGSCLNFHSNFEILGRIYNYLCEFKWELFDDDNRKIWIPKGTNNGEWVTPQDCVVHDKDNLFGEIFYVLDIFMYENKILNFFANVLDVKVQPNVNDYCILWKIWEDSGRQITHTECCAFWEFAVNNWNTRSKETFDKYLSRIPVLDPYSDRILLINKRDVFIGDDLFLMELFQRFSRPIFVWYPQPSLKSLTRTKLMNIYRKLGVRTLSESVRKIMSDVDHVKLERVNPKEKIIKKGLFKLILGFLAKPSLELDTERRHEAVSRILRIEAFETLEPLSIRNSISFSSGDVINVEEKRMIHWDKLNNNFFMQKLDRSSGYKNIMAYASHFSEEIADGVLLENEEHVPELSELIRAGFLVEFDEEAVDFLMKTKKLEILAEVSRLHL
ncbi:DNA binding,ATP binding protein [Artemisia annua]|uniref:DNA binding,ATP binding protein n=1 Tax=Artemisia annua TaxID=35608 RepID=A0A2U1ME90_ARTAN|nr:DNA binding,ATP binding protein [Artemisia annua]